MVGGLRARFSSPSFVALQQTEECTELAARDVRMELDDATLTECKEGGDGARLQVNEHGDGSAEDSPMQIDHGQLQIGVHARMCPDARICSCGAPVCAARWCTGSELAETGVKDRSHGQRSSYCVLCPERIRGKQPDRPYGKGRAHDTCVRRASRATAPLRTPIPRTKRPYDTLQSTHPSLSLNISSPTPVTTHQPSWHTHGTSLRPSTRTSRATAASWLDLARDSELDQWEKKRGGFYQHDTAQSLQCSSLDEKRVRLRHSAVRIARTQLNILGVDATSLNLAAMKLLRTATGEGLQEIHYDIIEYARAIKCYTVLMYLTDTLSTAIPLLPLADLRDTFTEGDKLPSAAARKFLSRDKFQSERVTAGDVLVFNCAVPHYGVANPDEHDRYVLFLCFSPANSPSPDTEQQRYPHGVVD